MKTNPAIFRSHILPALAITAFFAIACLYAVRESHISEGAILSLRTHAQVEGQVGMLQEALHNHTLSVNSPALHELKTLIAGNHKLEGFYTELENFIQLGGPHESIERLLSTIGQRSEKAGAWDKISSQNTHLLYSILLALSLFYLASLGVIAQLYYGRQLRNRLQSAQQAALAELTAAHTQASQSRLYLQKVIDHVADPIFVKDRQHRIIDGNHAFWRMIGRRREDVIGKWDEDLFPAEDSAVYRERDEIVFATRTTDANIESLTDREGKTHIIHTRKSCFEMEKGELLLVGVIRDITEQEHMQEHLRRSDEACLKDMLEHSPYAVCIRDTEGRYLQVNSRFLRLIAQSDGSKAQGATDYDFFPREFADRFRLNMQNMLSSQIVHESEEVLPSTYGASTYRFVLFPLYDESGKLYATCALWRDITERKMTENRLVKRFQELERKNRQLHRLLAETVQEMKKPLRVLQTQAKMVGEEYAGAIDEGAKRKLASLSQYAREAQELLDILALPARGVPDIALSTALPAQSGLVLKGRPPAA